MKAMKRLSMISLSSTNNLSSNYLKKQVLPCSAVCVFFEFSYVKLDLHIYMLIGNYNRSETKFQKLGENVKK